MNTKITLVIAAIAGTALMVLKHWKKQATTAKTDGQQRRNKQARPPGYRPLPDLSQADAPNIVALQYVDPAFSSGSSNHAAGFNRDIPYHHRGTRHH